MLTRLSRSRFWLEITFAAALVVVAITGAIVLRKARQDERTHAQDRSERDLASRRGELETRLQRAWRWRARRRAPSLW